MTGFIILSVVALVILVLLWAGERGNDVFGFRPRESDNAEYLVRLPRPALLRRFLSVEDVAFAARLQSPMVLRLLLGERRRLALEWLRITRREAGRLYRRHVRAARHATDLRPGVEAQLLAQICVFWILYELMCVLVRCYGPFRTQVFLRSMQALGRFLSGLSGHIADTAAPELASTPRPIR